MHPYFPSTGWINFTQLAITGTLNPGGDISVNEPRTPTPTTWTGTPNFKMTTFPTGPLDQFHGVKRLNSPWDVDLSGLDNPYGGGLYNGIWDDGIHPAYIGEAGGPDCTEAPYEPLLPMNPVEGMNFNITCTVAFINPATGKSILAPTPCFLKVLHVGKPWGQWPDTIRVLLIERPNQPDQIAYNDIYALGVGMVDSWELNSGDNNKGIQFYGMGHGGQ